MFVFSIPRKILGGGVLGLTLLCSALGGLALYLTRCDMRDYLPRAALAPFNHNEQFLYACGHVWHSLDGGHLWQRLTPQGLPLTARHGHIAIDRQPGFLYLGVLTYSQSSIYCYDCAWTKLRPAIYFSRDGGRTWTFAYKFKRGPAEAGGFLGLFADPDRSGAVYAVIRNDDEIKYYGSGTAGQFWKPLCTEYYFTGSGGCKLPPSVANFLNLNRLQTSSLIGE